MAERVSCSLFHLTIPNILFLLALSQKQSSSNNNVFYQVCIDVIFTYKYRYTYISTCVFKDLHDGGGKIITCHLDEESLSWNGSCSYKRLTTSNLKVQPGAIQGRAYICRGTQIIGKISLASSFEGKWIGLIPLKIQTNLEKVQHLTVGLLLRNGFGILKLDLSEGDEDLLLLSSGSVFYYLINLCAYPLDQLFSSRVIRWTSLVFV